MNDKKEPMPALTPDEVAKVEDAAPLKAPEVDEMPPVSGPGVIVLNAADLSQEMIDNIAKGVVVEITQTDTITARIAQLPCIQMALDFMVEVMQPIHLAPRFMGVGFNKREIDQDLEAECRKLLKEELLREWHAHFKESEDVYGEKVPDWIKAVNKVELIECDLLVPKEKK